MKLQTFYNAYDLNEMDIIKLYTKDDKLYLLLDCNTHLDLMGNGIRPELNVSYHHMFIFENSGYDINLSNTYAKSYTYSDGAIKMVVDGYEIILKSDPEVILNYV